MGSAQSITKSSANPSKYATPVDNVRDDDNLLQDPSHWKAYDFIIIGGGSAGCVLASRLSENPHVSVLVLEAGNSHECNFISSIPFLFIRNFFTDADWGFYLKPRDALNGREIYYPRGRILGGSSSINALIYHHCAPEDFDSWAREDAEGWSYEELRPYFIKSEGCISPLEKDGEFGTSGPIITRRPVSNEISKIIIETFQNLGIRTPRDHNNGTLGAASCVAAVNAKGRRSSTAVSYLTRDVLKRPNLKVAVNCVVERILFDKTENDNSTSPSSSNTVRPRAIGVEFRYGNRNGSLFRVASKKETLLCGGAVASPHILLLSGIGNSEELQKWGVKVVKHLPAVGKNFADHIACGTLNFQAKVSAPTYDYLRSPIQGLLTLTKWLLTGKGPLSELGIPGAAFVRSDDPCLASIIPPSGSSFDRTLEDTSSGPNSPDIEIVWGPLVAADNGLIKTSPKVKGIALSSVAVRPKSSGNISLATTNAWDAPIIDGNFFSDKDENDMKVVLRGIRLCLKLACTEPLASVLQLDPEPKYPFFWPGCVDPEKVTDDELIRWIRRNGISAWHPGCSCKMGATESTSVVSNRLQVHGVDSLRVIDASIFPTLVSGHPCAPVVAIAEKASDMIKKEYSI